MSGEKEAAKGKLLPKSLKRDSGPASTIATRSSDDAVATVLIRSAYTLERHYFLLRVIMGLLATLTVSMAMNFYQVTRPVQMRYIGMGVDGRIVELPTVDKPINTLADVTIWVTQSVIQAYTFSFANFRQEMSASEQNFTTAGWTGFQKAIKDSQMLQSVQENRYVTTAVPTGAPVLVNQGHIDGRYAWVFQLPIVVTFQSTKGNTSQNLMVDVVVVRQTETEQPRGLGIAQINAK